MLIDILNDHGIEQLVRFQLREENISHLILSTAPGQFQNVHPLYKLNDQDVFNGILTIIMPRIEKPGES